MRPASDSETCVIKAGETDPSRRKRPTRDRWRSIAVRSRGKTAWQILRLVENHKVAALLKIIPENIESKPIRLVLEVEYSGL